MFENELYLYSYTQKRVIKLKVGGAFHSRLMLDASEKMRDELYTLTFKKPRVKFIQNVSAKFEESPEVIRGNMITQICKTVRWRETVNLIEKSMEKSQIKQFIEIGPKNSTYGVLINMAKKSGKEFNFIAISDLKSFE